MSIGNNTHSITPNYLWNKLQRLLKRQAVEIKAGGLPLIRNKLLIGLGYLFAPLGLLIIRLLRPIFLLRFRHIRSDRIGHFASDTEIYICEKDIGIDVPPNHYLDISYHSDLVSNTQLKKMFERVLTVWPAYIAKPIDHVNRILPG